MIDVPTPEAELQALKDLVACDGWDIYQAHIAHAWGADACIAAIDMAITNVTPDDELAVTKRIRDTFKGVRAEATWATQRIAELEGAIKHKPIATVDRFLQFRRGPR